MTDELVVPEPAAFQTGLFKGKETWMMRNHGDNTFLLRTTIDDQLCTLQHTDREVLARYFSAVYGVIEWKTVLRQESASGLL